MRRFILGLTAVAVLAIVATAIAATQLPAVGAGALLFPSRRVTNLPAPQQCVDRTFDGVDVKLRGWECHTATAPRRGTIVYLHGIADNRASAIGVIAKFLPLGFDVTAYDSRGHGVSDGDRCTYGFYEKRDVQRVIDQLGVDDVILIGHSLGAAIALQAAAIEPRVSGVIAASTFSDLRTIATERAFYFPQWSLAPAFARAEYDGAFVVDEVSPVKAAAQIAVPVLLIHGSNDRDTPPAHSERVLAALRGPKQLVMVSGAAHNDVLNAGALSLIEEWLNQPFSRTK